MALDGGGKLEKVGGVVGESTSKIKLYCVIFCLLKVETPFLFFLFLAAFYTRNLGFSFYFFGPIGPNFIGVLYIFAGFESYNLLGAGGGRTGGKGA